MQVESREFARIISEARAIAEETNQPPSSTHLLLGLFAAYGVSLGISRPVHELGEAALADGLGDALRRVGSGREGFALSADAPRTIFHLDLQRRAVITSVPFDDAAELYATGTGVQLLALDRAGKNFSILPAEPLRPGVTAAAAPGD